MKVCPECDATIGEDALYCPQCGEEQSDPADSGEETAEATTVAGDAESTVAEEVTSPVAEAVAEAAPVYVNVTVSGDTSVVTETVEDDSGEAEVGVVPEPPAAPEPVEETSEVTLPDAPPEPVHFFFRSRGGNG